MPIVGLSAKEVAEAKQRKLEQWKNWKQQFMNKHWLQQSIDHKPMTSTEVVVRQQKHDQKQLGVYYGPGSTYSSFYFNSPQQPYPGNAGAITTFGPSIPERNRIAQRSLPREGIRAGEIIGYRCWKVYVDRLRSVIRGHFWFPDQPMFGDVGQGNGVYCFKSQELAYTIGQYNAIASQDTLVVGSVELWGDIVEHELGYRAQFAAVKSLDTAIGCSKIIDGWLLRKLRSIYLKEHSCQTSPPSSSASTLDQSKPKPVSPNLRSGTFLP